MTTVELNSLKYDMMRELMSINSQKLLAKIDLYIKQLKREAEDDAHIQFRRELKGDLEEALQEIRDVSDGKAHFSTMDDLYAELEK